MAKILDKKSDKYVGEARVYDCLERNLPDTVIGYYNREINGHEFDFCILIKNLGLMIIEVKGWMPEHVVSVKSPDEIQLKDYDKLVSSPKKQANGYRFALLNMLNSRYGINPVVVSAVAYPFISEEEYKRLGLNIVSEPEVTLFTEDLENKDKLAAKLGMIFKQNKVQHADKTSGVVYDTIRKHFEATSSIVTDTIENNYSELRIYSQRLTFSDIENILKNYTLGVKQSVFVKSKEELEALAENINKYFVANNISYKGNQLLLNVSNSSPVKVKGNKVLIFNFEASCYENIDDIFNENIIITNGCIPNDILDKVKLLAKKTNFNLQQYFVEHAPCDKHIQVRAGAGTGKTYSMISRISYICSSVSRSNVLSVSDEIAMLTFTDEAAINMRNRLKVQFRNYFVLTRDKHYLEMISNIERMRISTIHSFAKEIIQRTSIPLGIGTDFATVSGNYQRRQILRRHLSSYFERKIEEDPGFVYRVKISLYDVERYMMDFIDKCYNKGVDLRTIDSKMLGAEISGAEYLKEIILDVVKNAEIEYSQFLLDNNLVALSEYMIYLNKCIKDESFNPRLYHYKYLFIDEFQDVDDAQISIFKAMMDKIKFKYFIVGDLKQSIYRFRGATMDAFTKMGCDTNEWIKFSLNTNYRSDKRLLQEYDSLFADLGTQHLIPYGESDSLVGIKQSDETFDRFLEKVEYEATDENKDDLYDKLFDKVKDRIKELEEISKSKNLSESEKTIAILVRKNYEVGEILKRGRDKGVLVESDKNTNLYKLQSTIDLCKLTSALCNPYNVIYLYDFIYSNNINIKFSPLNLVSKSEEEKLEVLIDCLNLFFKEVMNKTWAEVVEDVQKNPTLQVLREIYNATKPWKNYSTSIEKQTYYRINYELIFESLARLNKRNYLTLESINESLIISITTGQEAKSRDVIEENNRVRVICITVHASKGLEYDTVILPYTQNAINEIKKDTIELSCTENEIGYCFNFRVERYANEFFDTKYEISEIKKEESRILYVALTRAINRCIWFGKKDNGKYNWNRLLEGAELCQ